MSTTTWSRVGKLTPKTWLRPCRRGCCTASLPVSPVRDEQVIGLTVAGMAACANAAEDLEVFLAVMRHAAELDLTRKPGSDPAQLVASSLVAGVEMPVAGRSELIRRLGALLVTEPWARVAAVRTTESGGKRSAAGPAGCERSARSRSTGTDASRTRSA